MQIPPTSSFDLAQILLNEPPDVWPQWGIIVGGSTAPSPVWFPRIAKGEITVVTGDPISPYRLVALDVAARLSAGLGWPDDANGLQSGRVLICTNQRGSINTEILPALRAAGANLAAITVVHAPNYYQATVAAENGAYDLVIIMWARLPSGGDASRTSQPDPLGTLCGQLSDIMQGPISPAVVIATEVKRGGKTVERGQNTVAGQAAVATAFMVSRDRSQGGPHGYVLLTAKAMIQTQTPDLGFELEFVAAHQADRVHWLGPVAPSGPGRPPKAVKAAEALLEALLAAGPQTANVVRARAEAEGISGRTLARAKAAMGIRSGGGPGSMWSLGPRAYDA